MLVLGKQELPVEARGVAVDFQLGSFDVERGEGRFAEAFGKRGFGGERNEHVDGNGLPFQGKGAVEGRRALDGQGVLPRFGGQSQREPGGAFERQGKRCVGVQAERAFRLQRHVGEPEPGVPYRAGRFFRRPVPFGALGGERQFARLVGFGKGA